MEETIHIVTIKDGAVGVIGDSEIALVGPGGEEITIPILEMPWGDERQWCGLVHEYLATETFPDGNCSMRDGNLCRLTADKPCLFDEPETSQGWQKPHRSARYITPEGERVLTRRQDIEGHEELTVASFLIGADVQLPVAVAQLEG